MQAIVTVIGQDRRGIIAEVCTLVASLNINILDISQTVMQNLFTMTMLVDISECALGFDEMRTIFENKGSEMNLKIRIQRTDIFNAMHQL